MGHSRASKEQLKSGGSVKKTGERKPQSYDHNEYVLLEESGPGKFQLLPRKDRSPDLPDPNDSSEDMRNVKHRRKKHHEKHRDT